MNTSFCESVTSTDFSEINSSFTENNQKNFKQITIPCGEELLHPLVKLQPIPKNHVFSDFKQYTSIMKGLLRENFLILIRDSIRKQCFYTHDQQTQNQKLLNGKSIEIFEEYQVLKVKFNDFKDLIINLIIKRKVSIDSSNQIKPNQLLVFFDKISYNMFLGKANIFQNDNNQHKKEKDIYGLEVEDNDEYESGEKELNSSSTHLQEEKIKIVMDLNQNLIDFLLNLNQIESKYLLLQPAQYLYPTEIALKSIEIFQKEVNSTAFPSSTLKNQNEQDNSFPKYDFLNDSNKTEYLNLVQEVINSKKSVLDSSQFETLKHSLLTSNTLIQGPPGTGKTYLGFQIIDALLKTYQSKSHRLILVLSKKNKSLDSILLKSILRIGNRISLEQIKKYSVKEKLGPFKQMIKSEQSWVKIKKNLKQLISGFQSSNKNLKNLANQIQQRLKNYQLDLDKRIEQTDNKYSLNMCNFMSQFQVIGMTVYGYLMNYIVIDQLQPEIVIVEEASEILEPDFITILTPWVKQLIQIGDHQQLRPLVRCQKIQEEYNLRLSYFERLIQGQHTVCKLETQRRMRTQFANFIRLFNSKYYVDDENVKKYPQISCIHNKTSIYYNSQYVQSTTTVNLAFDKILNLEMQGVIFTVDQYQGQENEIVILSCVRSNSQNEIGFLELENRINVAFSRAKKGFICLGNFLMYEKKCEIWKKINNLAKEQNSFYDQTRFCFNQFQDLFNRLRENYNEIQNIKCENCDKSFHIGIC
ncbi:hypothetical protein ABPG72_005305 [Tetrahymena utriculariae]